MQYSGRRAIIVEHGAIGRILLEKLLRQLGFSTVSVPDAEDVRDSVASSPPFDLAVVDGNLPGGELEDILRLLRPGDDASPRILLTVSREKPSLGAACPAPDGVALKPIGKASLERLIDEMLASGGRDGAPKGRSPGLAGIDAADVMDRLGGGPDILRSLLRIFANEHNDAPAAMRRLADQGDFARLEAQAHALKGAAANISAPDLRAAAMQVEHAAASQNPERLRAALLVLENRLEAVLASIKSLD